jgi:ABC-type branched-subunit amino acid transport system substrate-binding protein
MINELGGVKGRKLRLISLDDGYSPPRAVEQTRKLIEEEQVLAIYHSLGTPTNSATYRYVNAQKVPDLFIVSGAEKFRDPVVAPWTTSIVPAVANEAKAFARYILSSTPQARIGVLYQNDDLGRDMLKGLKQGLGSSAGRMIVAEASYEITDPTIDSQIVSLQGLARTHSCCSRCRAFRPKL